MNQAVSGVREEPRNASPTRFEFRSDDIGHRRIKFEAELDPDFCGEIMERVGDDSLRRCIQCGTCSSTCPVTLYMDYTPRRLVAMIREGFKSEVLSSYTPWLCTSCYSCTVQCPKEVKITEIMYTLKQKAIEEHIHPKRFAIPVLAKEFFKMASTKGRTNEGMLISRVFMKINPLRLFQNSRLGIRLLGKGRMEVFSESIKQKDQLQLLLKAVERQRGAANGNDGNQ